jgi:(p)ppGpp synthase/HD superfamily hydrolase
MEERQKEEKMREFREWAVEQHAKTNHFYDIDLPYRFHLQMVANEAHEFREVGSKTGIIHSDLLDAAWGHDLIEDARVSYNDVKTRVKVVDTAEIIYAVTNEKGRNRAERTPDYFYHRMKEVPGAVFIKFCDRIANVKYGVMTGSDMVKKYEKENAHFIQMIGDSLYQPMMDKLDRMFKLVI